MGALLWTPEGVPDVEGADVAFGVDAVPAGEDVTGGGLVEVVCGAPVVGELALADAEPAGSAALLVHEATEIASVAAANAERPRGTRRDIRPLIGAPGAAFGKSGAPAPWF